VRLFVMHDGAGNISQVVTCPDDTGALYVTPPEGMFYTECDVPEGFSDSDTDAIEEFMRSNRIDVSPVRASIVRRD
jgi:hypothetical protein